MTAVGPRHSGSGAPIRGAVIPRLWGRLRRSVGVGRLADRLWYDRPVQWQLLATFIFINLMTGVAAAVIVIYNAHEATKVEVAASMEVADQVTRRAVDQLAQETSSVHSSERPPLQALAILARRLRHLRHVRISIADATGRQLAPLAPPPADAGSDRRGRPQAPGWFAALFQIDKLRHEVPVTLGSRYIGTVLVTSQPADEIAEVWRDVSDLAVVVLIANTVVIGLFYLALRRILTPLTSLATGLRELEEGRFGHRLPRPRVRELTDIADRFNALAGALDAARTDNTRLNRRLVTVQDDERRQIANELHDELGACLFGLRANVLSVKQLADALPPGVADAMRRRAETLVEVSERIQTTNRRVLRSIRPMALGHAALADVIADLVADFERNDPERSFELGTGQLRYGYGDCVDLTVYRCVQEGLTNAVRHGEARTAVIRLEELAALCPEGGSAAVALRLSIADDGRGFAPGASLGLGLTGMERRISVLGGVFTISNRPAGGACLDITIPVDEAEPGAAVPVDRRTGRQ